MSITVVGSVALDSITSNEGSVERALGGSAIHFSNAASLTSDVRIVGVVGGDFPFDDVRFLKDRGVDFSSVEVVEDGKTFFWKGRYEGDMNTAITEITDLNVFENFAPKLDGKAAASEFLFLANIHPALQDHVLQEKQGNPFVMLDSMNLWIDTTPDALDKVIRQVDGVILNDQEIRSFTGINNLLMAGKEILQRGPGYVIIKKGEHGVLAMSKDWIIVLPAIPLEKIVDPTGAGDSFAGALVGYLDRAGKLDQETWKLALLYATCVASFNVRDFSVAGIAGIKGQDITECFNSFKKYFFIPGDIDVTTHVTV